MISTCTVYGFLAIGPIPNGHSYHQPIFNHSAGCLHEWGLITYFTYFKDYEGDTSRRQKYHHRRHASESAKMSAIFGSFMPTILFFALSYMKLFPICITEHFVYCGIMTIFLLVWTACAFIATR
jgi:geranylgeranylglycerol-phosphate geranylgeranyltransferase